MKKFLITCFIASLMIIPSLSYARVTEIVVTKIESPIFGGTSFGDVGQYERIEGVIKCEVNPNNPLNKDIVNIDKAPRNSSRLVEYDVDFVMLKPIDMTKGNGHILYDTANRGNMGTISIFNAGPRNNHPSAPADAGDGFLMKKGYTIISSGWQVGYPVSGIPSFLVGLGSKLPMPAVPVPANTPLLARYPVAKNYNGSSVTGLSRELFASPDTAGTTSPFTGYLTYPAANFDKSQVVLTVRQRAMDERTPMPASSWDYINENSVTITRDPNFDMGAIYEFIYPAKDPVVYGLGFASIRDVVSFFRYEKADSKGNPNPLASGKKTYIKKALAYGMSQTGRIVKTLVVEGFNADEKCRIVFDGINSHIGGGRKNWLNGEFSHPGDIFGDDQFPFTYKTLYDPLTHSVDGNLVKSRMTHTTPKIIHTDTETEVWSSFHSLVVTDTKGHDISIPRDVRVYLFSGTKHTPGPFPKGVNKYDVNPVNYAPISRALLVALDEWVSQGITPPESRYPKRCNKTLVPFDQASIGFPNIPGVTFNGLHEKSFVINYSVQPPQPGAEYPLFAGKTDKDGNMIAGLRMPDISVPIGTYTGWNHRAPGWAEEELSTASGSYFPFAKTKAERLASGDPRLSIEERYSSHDNYVKKVTDAVNELIDQGFLLVEDGQKIIDTAAASTIGNPQP